MGPAGLTLSRNGRPPYLPCMALHSITVPQWGFSMESGKVVAWHRQEGDVIASGDEVLDVESSKIANVVEAHVAGTLRRIVASEGEELPVGALLAVLTDADEDEAAIDAFVTEFQERFEKEAVEGGAAKVEPVTEQVGGRPIRYLSVGEGEGLPVVLIHGYGGDLDNFLFNTPALAAARRVVALDLPGHGGSVKDVGDGNLKTLGAAVTDLMDHLGLDRAHLVGHSMGGGIALLLALKHPDRVASVTTLNGAAYGKPVNMDYVRGFAEAQRRKDLKPVAQMLFANEDLVTRDMLDDMLRYKRLDGVEAALGAMTEAFEGANPEGLRNSLGELSMPVLGIWGEEDQVIPLPDFDSLPGTIRIERVGEAGHMPHMEAAAKVNDLISAHLEAHDS